MLEIANVSNNTNTMNQVANVTNTNNTLAQVSSTTSVNNTDNSVSNDVSNVTVSNTKALNQSLNVEGTRNVSNQVAISPSIPVGIRLFAAADANFQIGCVKDSPAQIEGGASMSNAIVPASTMPSGNISPRGRTFKKYTDILDVSPTAKDQLLRAAVKEKKLGILFKKRNAQQQRK